MRGRIGVDLGGTKIEAAVLGPKNEWLWRRREATPGGDYPATLSTIARLVEAAETEIDCSRPIGIGIPGSPSPSTGLIRNANSVCLNGAPLQLDLETLLGRPVRLANDANCFILSETHDGSAQGARCAFGVILGTGTGGGITVDGRLLTGTNAVAGEWGHNPLPWPTDGERPGPACYCGKYGCIETFLSGPGLTREHEARTGERLDPAEIARAADTGDARAERTLQLYEDRLARALAGIINIVDPDVVVLGGGLSNLSRLYERVPRIWSRYVFSDQVRTSLQPARHGDSSGVRGAAWLWDAG